MPFSSITPSSVIELLQRLVRTDSVNPHCDPRPADEANEEAIADLVTGELAAAGIASRIEFAALHRPVLIAEIGRGEGPVLMLNAHLDTVGVAKMQAPFSGDIRDGRLYGRGACDTKASLAAMIAAFKSVAAAGAAELQGRCILTAVCDEEYGGLGSKHVVALGITADAAIVGEPTRLELGIGQVGGVKFKISCHGRATHGNTPEAGISAIMSAAQLALRLPEVAAMRHHPLLGSPTCNIGKIVGGIDASVVPDFCELDCDRRIMPGETVDEIYADIQGLLDAMTAADSTFKATLEAPYLGPVYGFELASEHPLVATLRRACETVLDDAPREVVTPFGGDGMYLYGAGIPAVTFGPGDIHDAHSDNESVAVTQVVSAARVYAESIVRFCRP